MLYSVVSAYRNISTSTEASALAIDTATAEPTSEPTAEPTVTPTTVTPVEAAQLAAQVVGNSSLLSAESSVINNLAAYKITFTNNDVVYVGLDGQILGVQIAPLVVNVAVPAQTRNHDRNHMTIPAPQATTVLQLTIMMSMRIMTIKESHASQIQLA